MNLWDPQRILVEDYLGGKHGSRVVYPALKRRLSNGTTTAVARFAANNELCYVSERPEQRNKFLDYLCNMVSAFGHEMAPVKDGFEITNANGSKHRVVAVGGADACAMTTFVEDGEPVECEAPLVVRKQVYYRK